MVTWGTLREWKSQAYISTFFPLLHYTMSLLHDVLSLFPVFWEHLMRTTWEFSLPHEKSELTVSFYIVSGSWKMMRAISLGTSPWYPRDKVDFSSFDLSSDRSELSTSFWWSVLIAALRECFLNSNSVKSKNKLEVSTF